MVSSIRIGVDLGGTKIEGIALNQEGEELYKLRVDTPKHDADAIFLEVRDIVLKIEKHVEQTASVGIGTPGAISKSTGLLKNSNTVVLNGLPIKKNLEGLLNREIRIANDANCFALSEAIDGAAAGGNIVFGVILGTGVGGGIVVNGQLLMGANLISGEWGHNPLPWLRDDEQPGPQCYCGNTGCIETFLSGPGLALDYLSLTGEQRDALSISEFALKQDNKAVTVLRRYEERLSRALANVVNILDPDVIVLGGGLSNIASLYENVPKLWQQYIFSDDINTKIVPPKYGDSSGVRGAAWLWN